ncbi:MAG: hypothetical protein HQL58_08220 [Magnetococcales bacterium]|nr:hypothetical protein [Magnetococcales bacterium]
MIDPADLRDFICSQGWNQRQEWLEDRLYVLENPAFPRRQLVFPMDKTASDYDECIRRVIGKMGELMRIGPDELLSRMRWLREDVLQFRIVSDHDPVSTLPLGFALSMVNGIQMMLKATACSVVHPRLHHARMVVSPALRLIERTRFNQTQAGSFIMRVSCPIDALEPLDSPDHPLLPEMTQPIPFVRRVTMTLQQGLAQLIEAIELDQVDAWIGSLRQSSRPLVSANLCQALGCFHDSSLDHALSIQFDWSPLQAVAATINNRPLWIRNDDFARIAAIQDQLRQEDTPREERLIGTVEQLNGVMDQEGYRSGEVVVALLLPGGNTVHAKVTLDRNDYAKAYQAHMQHGLYAQISGRLHAGNQPQQITDLTHFELVHPDHFSPCQMTLPAL